MTAMDLHDFLRSGGVGVGVGEDDNMVLSSPIRDTEPCEAERETRSVSDFEATTAAAEELNSIVNSSATMAASATLLNTASNPVSPGPSSPPLEQSKGSSDFVPPTRPSSTPFPNSEPRDSICCLPSEAEEGHDTDMLHGTDDDALPVSMPDNAQPDSAKSISLEQLPDEIHEGILDHLFGFRVSATSKSSVGMACVTKSLGTMLRHSRRREVSRLALVSPVWRDLVQARLYRHVKIKGTLDSLADAFRYLKDRPRLAKYVKHLEIWFPVFQPRSGPLALGTTDTLPLITQDGLGGATYLLPPNNASLKDVLDFAAAALPGICIMTLEGGERRKAPKVQNVRPLVHGLPTKMRPRLPLVQTLVTRGLWNLMRHDDDFEFVLASFPNLVEWHALYSKPKSKSYLSMGRFLPWLLAQNSFIPNSHKLARNMTHLNLCLEGDYRRESQTPRHYAKVCGQMHFCTKLAEATMPQLESLTYTGRICRAFFEAAAIRAPQDPRLSKLKAIDITLKNTCRVFAEHLESGSGIQDWKFIQHFEALVLAAVKSMEKLAALEFLRIRYVDLDSPCPPLNPYFCYKNGHCTGVWSERIIDAMHRVRPQATFENLCDCFGGLGWWRDGVIFINSDAPRSRVKSQRIESYRRIQPAVPSI